MAEDDRGHFDFIDLIKGCGIFLVVWGHTMEPRSVYIYSFHMPLFFFVSGYLHRDRPPGEFFRAKFTRLYLPYVGFSVLSWLFYLVVLNLQKEWDVLAAHLPKLASIFTGTAANGGNDSIWFLPCLLVVSLLYLAIERLPRAWLKPVAVAVLAAMGFFFGARRLFLPFKLDVACNGLAFYYLGHLAKEKELLRLLDRLGLLPLAGVVVLAEVAHLAGARLNVMVSGIPKVAMISNNLGHGLLFYGTALIGVAAFTAVGYRIGSLGFLNHLGANSLAILALHKPLLYLFGLGRRVFAFPPSRLYGLAASIAAIALILPLAGVLKRRAPWLVGAGTSGGHSIAP